MEQHKLLIPRKPLWIIIILGFLMAMIGAFLKIQQYHFFGSEFIMLLGFALNVLGLLIVWIDVIRNSFNNKVLWVMGLFFFNSFCAILYLYQRNDLLTQFKDEVVIDPINKNLLKKIKIGIIGLIIFLVISQLLGAILKINHLPGASPLLVASIVSQGLLVVLGITYFLIKKKAKANLG